VRGNYPAQALGVACARIRQQGDNFYPANSQGSAPVGFQFGTRDSGLIIGDLERIA